MSGVRTAKRRPLIGCVSGLACLVASCVTPYVSDHQLLASRERAHLRLGVAVNTAQRFALPSRDEIDRRIRLTELLMDEREFVAADSELAFLARARPASFELHYLQGRAQLVGLADAPAALTSADRCIAAAPDIGRCHELRGMALQDVGRRDDALIALQTARDLDPYLLGIEERIGRLLLQADRTTEAIAMTRIAMERDRRNASLWLMLGHALERDGQYDEAETAYLHAAQLHSDPRQAWAWLVRMYRATGRDREADALLAPAPSSR
jgi:Flp pilus assembly protein TadD